MPQWLHWWVCQHSTAQLQPSPCVTKDYFTARQVAMDRYMGCVSNELATITGLELTVAPRRPAHMTHK